MARSGRKRITPEITRLVAAAAGLDLDEDRAAVLAPQQQSLLDAAEALDRVDLTDVEPNPDPLPQPPFPTPEEEADASPPSPVGKGAGGIGREEAGGLGPQTAPIEGDDLCFLSLAETARLVAAREVSPVAVVRAVLDRIEKLEGTVGAYVTVLGESALQEARQAEEEIARGHYRGPLHGIPVSLKDLIYVKGVRCTAGSRVLADFVPDHDASVVERLRAAGAVLIGKAQTYEFAMGPSTTYHYGPTRNPWDLTRVTTGSSSGSAAGVAAGLCHASLGSDTGGSIRGPAACCGVVGFKPTFGRVSRYGVVPLSWSLDHVGPLARTVLDCALVMQAVAGHDPRDPTSGNMPVPDYSAALERGVQGLRIGVPSNFFFEGLEPEFEAPVRQAIALLASAGAHLTEVSLPSCEQAQAISSVIQLPEAASAHRQWIRDSAPLYGATARTRTESGALVPAGDYLDALRFRTLLRREFVEAMREVDAIVTPTLTGRPPTFDVTMPLHDGSASARTSANRFRRYFNLVGAPALTVPCGFTSDGLPVALQVVARPWEDEMALRVAHAYQQRTDWHLRRPPLG